MDAEISLQLKNDLAELERLNEAVTDFGAAAGLPEKILFDINLALEEIVTNVISYGYGDSADHRIGIRLRLRQEELTAEVEDDGRPFNPLESPEPDFAKPLEERPIGGLGIHLVRKVMSGLEYRREGGKNLLVMKKKTREG
jgi:anti-sigma regulatory factor (Ser/Thr protein kinase)